jgi:hypothetical protein
MIWYIISIRDNFMKDALGATCAGLCLVHCLGLPVLAATGTTFIGLAALSSESVHLWLSAGMAIIALWAFPSGWHHHKRVLPGVLAIVGAVLMAGALLMPENLEVFWVVTSGITFICAHLMNRHLLISRNMQ